MGLRLCLSAAVVCTFVFSSFASIQLSVFGTDQWTTASGEHLEDQCSSNPGAAWRRTAGISCVREGKITPVATGCADQIAQSTSNRVFRAETGHIEDSYIVYGKTETFMVDETGDYTFSVNCHIGVSVWINGKLLNPLDFVNWTGETAGGEQEGGRTNWRVTGVPLTAGTHTLEFMYFGDSEGQSKVFLRWKTPSMFDEEVIPASAFGTPCLDNSIKVGMVKGFNNLKGVTLQGNQLKIANTDGSAVRVNIVNIKGSRIFSRQVASNSTEAINVESIISTAGTYIVQVIGNGRTESAQFFLR